jgi:hypothetical protein
MNEARVSVGCNPVELGWTICTAHIGLSAYIRSRPLYYHLAAYRYADNLHFLFGVAKFVRFVEETFQSIADVERGVSQSAWTEN